MCFVVAMAAPPVGERKQRRRYMNDQYLVERRNASNAGSFSATISKSADRDGIWHLQIREYESEIRDPRYEYMTDTLVQMHVNYYYREYFYDV